MNLFGFFYNGMIHESAPALVSLHRSKATAWKAMRALMLAMAQEERDFAIQYGGRQMMRNKPLQWKWFGIQEIAVLP